MFGYNTNDQKVTFSGDNVAPKANGEPLDLSINILQKHNDKDCIISTCKNNKKEHFIVIILMKEYKSDSVCTIKVSFERDYMCKSKTENASFIGFGW